MSELFFSILLLGLITFLYRYSFISSTGKSIAQKIPSSFLALLAPATFAAIIANSIGSQAGEPSELKRKVLVAILSLFVAYGTKSIIVTLSFGLILLYLLQNYFPHCC